MCTSAVLWSLWKMETQKCSMFLGAGVGVEYEVDVDASYQNFRRLQHWKILGKEDNLSNLDREIGLKEEERNQYVRLTWIQRDGADLIT